MKNPQSMKRRWAAWAAAGALVMGSASAIAADRTLDLMPVLEKMAAAEGKFRVTDAFFVAREGETGARARNGDSRIWPRTAAIAGGTTDLPWAENILQALEEDQRNPRPTPSWPSCRASWRWSRPPSECKGVR